MTRETEPLRHKPKVTAADLTPDAARALLAQAERNLDAEEQWWCANRLAAWSRTAKDTHAQRVAECRETIHACKRVINGSKP